MAGEERSHAFNCGKAYAATTSKVARPGHTATNALFPGFLRRQTALAMFLAQF